MQPLPRFLRGRVDFIACKAAPPQDRFALWAGSTEMASGLLRILCVLSAVYAANAQ